MDKQFEAFRAMILAQFARLAEQAGRYIGRMSNENRESVLELALDFAWYYRVEIVPGRNSLLLHWDNCLGEAARYHDHWYLRTFDGWERTDSQDLINYASIPREKIA